MRCGGTGVGAVEYRLLRPIGRVTIDVLVESVLDLVQISSGQAVRADESGAVIAEVAAHRFLNFLCGDRLQRSEVIRPAMML